MKKLFTYFIGGLVVLIPVFFVYQIIQSIAWLGRKFFFELNLFAAFIFSFLLIAFLGYIVSKGFWRTIKKRMVKTSSTNGTFSLIFKILLNFKTFSEKTKEAFKNPVYFEVSEGIHKIGFVTNTDNTFLQSGETVDKKITVYAPNPINFFGELLFIDQNMIQPIPEKDKKDIPLLLLSAGVFKEVE